MCNEKKYPLSLNGDTFNALKSDFDQQLRQLLTEMEKRESEEATINIKIAVSLQPDQARDFEANGFDAMRNIVKPSFKHEVSTVMQVKSKKTGSLSGNYELVWDRELCQYVMQVINDGQVTLFDQKDDEPGKVEPAALFASEGAVLDADYRVVEDDETKGDEEDAGEQKDVSGGVPADPNGPFEYMKQFIGADLSVTEAMGNYTLRASGNRVILSSAFGVTDRFYCSAEMLSKHVGHELICIGRGGHLISIYCQDCDETLFYVEASNSTPDDYEYEDPDEQGVD